MKSILVSNIQRLCVSDGPGVRTVVFLKGCSLKCPWCCNPETIYKNKDLYYDNYQCIKDSDNPLCNNCELKGGNISKTDCQLNAFKRTFEYYSSKQLIRVIENQTEATFCDGVTFSGGEPLLQMTELEEVFFYLKTKKISIAIETSLHAPIHYLKLAIKYVDFWIIDLKLQRQYFKFNQYEIKTFQDNLMYLQNFVDSQLIKYRMVILKNVTNDYEQIASKLELLNITSIELLPVHNLAKTKYKKLHRKFQEFEEPTQSDMQILCDELNIRGINAICEH